MRRQVGCHVFWRCDIWCCAQCLVEGGGTGWLGAYTWSKGWMVQVAPHACSVHCAAWPTWQPNLVRSRILQILPTLQI
jgi:hypothetical protein